MKEKLIEVRDLLKGHVLALIIILVTMLGILVTVYLAKQQQNLRSRAKTGGAGSLVFTPSSGGTVNKDSVFNLDFGITLTPATRVTGVDITITYTDNLSLKNFANDTTVLPEEVLDSKDPVSVPRTVRYVAVNKTGDLSSRSFVQLGTLTFTVIGDGQATITIAENQIVAKDQPLLDIGGASTTYTIAGPSPSPADTSCPATISITEVRGKLHGSSDAWSTAPTITEGQSLDVAGFHSDDTTTLAPDVSLSYTGPQGSTSSTQNISPDATTHIGTIIPSRGTYSLTAQVPGVIETSTPKKCTGTASLTVNAAAITTASFRIAENLSDLSNVGVGSTGWQAYTPEIAAGAPVNYTFKDTTPEVKTVFVQFKDSNNKTGGCGDGSQPCQVQIKLLGPDPSISGCSLSFDAGNTTLNLTGQNFGSGRGTVKSGDTNLSVSAWTDSSIQAVWSSAPTGQILPVVIANPDGQSAQGNCSAIAQLSVGAKVLCSQPSAHQTNNVDLSLAGAFQGGTKIKQNVSIDNNGVIQNLNAKLETGKNYVLSLKAPKALRTNICFTAQDGTTNISNFVLPVGDIFPADGGDGQINSFDHNELVRQWNIVADTTRTGDFNLDSRVNSIDWACMRNSWNGADMPEPTPGPQQSVPCPSISPSPSPSVSPSPGPSSSPSPSPSSSPSPASSLSPSPGASQPAL